MSTPRDDLLAMANDHTHHESWRAVCALNDNHTASAREHALRAKLWHEAAYQLATFRTTK